MERKQLQLNGNYGDNLVSKRFKKQTTTFVRNVNVYLDTDIRVKFLILTHFKL